MRDEPDRNFKLHYTLFGVLLILLFLRIIVWFTPTNKLHEYGLDLLDDLDFSFGFGAALVIAIASFINRKSTPSRTLYFITQILAWGSSVGSFTLIIVRAIYVAMNGGV